MEAIQLGESQQCSTEHKQFAFSCALHAIRELSQNDNNNNNMENTYANQSRFITSSFAKRFGGDWVCLMGKHDSKDGAVFSYFIPSIRHMYFLVGGAHFVHIAQIFEPHTSQVVRNGK